jgi:AraC-like DNA-binding protein
MSLVNEVLEGLHLESSVFCRMTLHGDWGFAKEALSGAPFHLIISGHAWLDRNGAESIRLDPGDIVILPHGDAHHLLAKPDGATISFAGVSSGMGLTPWLPGVRYRAVDFRFGSGDVTTTLISGVFAFGDQRRNPLLEALPSVLLLRSGDDIDEPSVTRVLADLLDKELLSGTPGAEIVSTRLADILFIQVIRDYLKRSDALPRGWLLGMADPAIAPALVLMQREPARSWSVESLAREIGMSRSRFAARFQNVVGQGPLEYLTHWRMYCAAGQLLQHRSSVSDVAVSVGYQSEVSFSKAFKRWASQTPAEYRRQRLTPQRARPD